MSIFKNWNPKSDPSEALGNCDVILTHEFGNQKITSRTTLQMVHLGVLLSETYNKPLICQFPGNIDATRLGVIPIKAIERPTPPLTYLDTNEVNRQAAEYCRTRDWKSIILVTHPHHAWRAQRNLSKMGFYVALPALSSIRYDRECTRLALRTPLLFVPREILSRILYRHKGWC